METIKTLSKKPLVEAMFELRWGLDGVPGVGVDPYYQLLVGRMSDALKSDFPLVERLPLADVQENLAPYAPRYRFRKSDGQWPLVQLGPGLLTFNDTEGYVWDQFFPLCVKVLDVLFSVYPNAHENLRILESTLRYIDADQLDEQTAIVLLEKLNISLRVPETLFVGGRIGHRNLGIGLSLSYPCLEPKGLFQLNFNQGKKNDQDALIWETQVVSRGAEVPHDVDSLKTWLVQSHDTVHDWFFRQIEGELLEKYR